MRLDTTDDVEDETLVRLQQAVEAIEAVNRPMRASKEGAAGVTSLDPPPFDVEPAAPRAIDLRRLWALTDTPVPPAVDAALGPRIPVLVVHKFTAFHPAGRAPRGVWGMGYEARLLTSGAVTEAVAPDTRRLRVAGVSQNLRIEFAAGGQIRIPEAALPALDAIPGVQLHGLTIGATGDTSFGLGIDLDLTVLECQAGPVGAGGARWNLYRQKDPLDGSQRLMHTLLLERPVPALRFVVTLWVRRAGFLGTSWGARQWSGEPVELEVSLEGLS